MNLWLRLLTVFLTALRGARSTPQASLTIDLRILPGDIDLNGHVNNGRYLSLLDLGRADFVARTGLFQAGRRHKINGWVAAATIRYRRPLLVGQRIRLTTRLLGWDGRSFFVAHKIESNGDVATLALVRVRVLGPKGPVSPNDAAVVLGLPPKSPPLPAVVTSWVSVDNELDSVFDDAGSRKSQPSPTEGRTEEESHA